MPVYVGPSSRAAKYLGIRSDAELYLGADILFPASQIVYLILFAGQSNVPGRNELDGNEADHPDIYQWGGDSNVPATYRVLTTDTTPMDYPQQPTTPTKGRIGPDKKFMELVRAANDGAKVIGVNTAVGSSAVHNGPWGVGGSHYTTSIDQMNAARTAALARWPGAEIRPIIYFGIGEQDASLGTTTAQMGASMEASILGMRAGIAGASDAPCVIQSTLPQKSIIGSPNYLQAYEDIEIAKVGLSVTMSNVIYVWGPDDRTANDNLHYQDADVARLLGTTAYNVYTAVNGPNVTSTLTVSNTVGNALAAPLTGAADHQTYEIVTGLDAAEFEIVDPYTRYPSLAWTGNGTGPSFVGPYSVNVRARDGKGNFGTTVTFVVTVEEEGAVSPATFFDGDPGGVYNPDDISTLWQDNLRTIPVTASGQPVGCVDDLSPNGNHLRSLTDAGRPTYIVDGDGKGILRSDGVNTLLVADAIWTLAPGTIFTAVAAQKAAAQSGESTLIGQYGSNTSNFLDFMQSANGSTNVRINGRYDGGGLGKVPNVGPFYDNTKRVASSQVTNSQGVAQIRDATTSPTWGDTDGLGTLKQTASFGSASVFARRYSSGTTNTRWAGDLGGFVIIGKILTEQQIQDAEAWAAATIGATI